MLSIHEEFDMGEWARDSKREASEAAHVKNGKVNPIEIIQKRFHSAPDGVSINNA